MPIPSRTAPHASQAKRGGQGRDFLRTRVIGSPSPLTARGVGGEKAVDDFCEGKPSLDFCLTGLPSGEGDNCSCLKSLTHEHDPIEEFSREGGRFIQELGCV